MICREAEHRAAAVAILDVRRMGLDDEAAAVGVDQRVALASIYLLSSIVTAGSTGLSGFDALAVDDCGRGAGVPPNPFAICHHERVVYPFQSARRRARRRTLSPTVADRSAPAATGSPSS